MAGTARVHAVLLQLAETDPAGFVRFPDIDYSMSGKLGHVSFNWN